jgi:pimeloyl-ACP methyl ester carboxylesterase
VEVQPGCLELLIRLWTRGVGIALLAVLLIGGADLRAQDPANALPVPRIEWDICPFPIPDGEVELGTIECGYTVSPENHLLPGGYEVAIAFAILYARQTEQPRPNPIIILADQPGESLLMQIESWLNSPLRQRRDLILYDGRGVGYSVPSLDCPELDLFLGASRVDLNGGYTQAERACYARLITENNALNTYNSAQAAADLAAFRDRLSREKGYTTYNIYASGYGARLALTALRDSPTAIRSVILDSPQPPRASLIDEQGRLITAALRRLFDDCAADLECAAAYPDLEARFYATFDRLNREPLTYQVLTLGGTPLSVTLTGNSFLQLVLDSMADQAFLPLLPLFIDRMADGDFSVLGARVPGALMAGVSEGVRNAMLCREEIIFNSQVNAESYAGEFPEPIRASLLSLTDSMFATCAYWLVGEANVLETAAVFSAIPALVLSSGYDPFSSPEWGALTAETLSASFYVRIDGAGHIALDSGDCAAAVALRFLDDPTTRPDSSCAAALAAPDFIVR